MSNEGRRRFGRFERQLLVELSHESDTRPAETINLSLGGMFVATDLVAPYGAEVEFRLHMPDPKHVVHARGTIMWVKKQDGLGIAFESLRPLDVWALLQFFNRSTAAGAPGAKPISEPD
jgi:hypothetical protein